MRIRTLALSTGLAALFAATFQPTPAMAYGEGWANCLVVSDSRLSSLDTTLRLTVVNGCTTAPTGYQLYSAKLSLSPSSFSCPSLSSQSESFPSRYVTGDLRFDLSCLPPGRYSVRLDFSVISDFSNKSVDLGSLTIEAPADPGPSNLGSAPSGSGGSGGAGTGGKTCMYPQSTRSYCWAGYTWRYAVCWTNAAGARLQVKENGTWLTVDSSISEKGRCSKGYRWSVTTTRTEPRKGTVQYRIYIPGIGGNAATVEKIRVSVS